MIPLLILMPLVHGTSVIWVAIMMASLLLSRLQNVTIVLYLASSFVSAVSYLDILNNYSNILPQFMQNQVWSYTQSEYALERMAGANEVAYAIFLNALPGYFQILLCVLLILNRKEINQNKEAGILMTLMLALAAITNFLSGIPSMGRFQAFVIPFLVIVWSLNHDILKKYDKI